ncbi:MAG: hypothetical protein C0423_10275 [Methylibium sp.]|nr:hypothetical protein [Methylibium sp.]
MNSSSIQIGQSIAEFLSQQAQHVTHIAVAHTACMTYGLTAMQMEGAIAKAKRDCRHFRNCLNSRLYGPRARRKPQLFQPLIIATLEGSLVTSDPHLTLHYNFSFGNLPSELSDAELYGEVRDCWVNKAGQRDDICFQSVAGNTSAAQGWIGYSLKEAQARGNTEVWDFENTQIPYDAFAAG